MWDIKYRPLKFTDVLGQDGAVQLLKARLRKETLLDTSYIFAGGHGQGKTTLARILARAILCHNLNKVDAEPCNVCDSCQAILNEEPSAYEERDAASGGTIGIVRQILDDLPFTPPMGAKKRVYLFDETHRMPATSQDALLKAVEDKRLVALFCTTEAEGIRGPIRSRCEEYTIRKITREDVLGRMRYVLKTEGVAFEDDAVLVVIDHSGGHVRDVLNKLEMISQMGAITLDTVRQYLQLGTVTTYYEILLALGNSKLAIELVERACERVPPDEVAAGIAEAAMNSFRLMNKMPADFAYVDKQRADQVYQRFGLATLKLAEFFLRGRAVTRIGLTCDVLSLAESGGVPPIVTGTSAPPLVLQIAAPVAAAALHKAAEVSAVESTRAEEIKIAVLGAAQQVITEAVAQQAAVAPPAQQAAPVQQTAQPPKTNGAGGNGKLRSDGIGSLGSGDPLAMTEVDHNGVPQTHPRRTGVSPSPVVLAFNSQKDDDQSSLSWEAWKREFARTWPRGG
jgi:DNA polymerase III subunit gamma/tau